MRFVLASASPARLSVLRAAGVDPVVRVSGVDEHALAEALPNPSPVELVTELARGKADAVARDVREEYPNAVVVGCDSMLWTGGDEVVGKPDTAKIAAERWGRMAGGTGELLTGHSVMLLRDGSVTDHVEDHSSTTVRFGQPSPDELDSYIATGEPLAVAGAFTLDGLGGWFIEGIDGDPSSVIGISLPLTRKLLGRLGVSVVSLWETNSAAERAS